MRLNTKTHHPVTIEEQPPDDVVEFVYLGSNAQEKLIKM